MMSMSGAVTCNLPDRSPVRVFVADPVLARPSLRLREAAAVRGPLAAAPGAGRGAGPGVAHVLGQGAQCAGLIVICISDNIREVVRQLAALHGRSNRT